jgi:predicted permease
MRLPTWILARLVGTPAAQAIVGDVWESCPDAGLARYREIWRVVLSMFRGRVHKEGAGVGLPVRTVGSGSPRPPRSSRRAPGAAALGDIRFAVRIFRSHPVSTGVAIVSLALGIGANTAIFSLLDNILLRPLPVARPGELITSPTVFSFPDYDDLAAASRDELVGLAAWSTTSRPYSVADDTGAWPALTELTTGNFFELLELRPSAGRLLVAADDTQAAPVAVLSHRLWQTAFAADPDIAGHEVRVNGVPATVVGVAPPGFRGTRVNRSVDLWMPLSLHTQLATGSRARLQFENRGSQWLRIMGRLQSGVSLDQAESALLATAARLLEEQPSPYLEDFQEISFATTAAVPRADDVRRFMTLLLGMVGAALLVACTNVANVLLTRTAERRREIGLRMALGAPRSRLIRQLFTESVLLSVIGGLVALLFARWTLASVSLLQIPGRIVLGDVPTELNLTTLGFAMAIAFGCSLLFGVGPAIAGTRPDVARSTRAVGQRRWNAPATLAAMQVGLTLALVFGGGLFLRSLSTALDVPLGFDPEGVYVATIDLGVGGYAPGAADEFRRASLASIEALPNIERAAWAIFVPVQSGMRMESFRVVGHEMRDGDPTDVGLNYVSTGFFETLDMTVRGRAFDATDGSGGPPVVIVNETFARTFWSDGSAIGQRIILPGPEGALEMEIVGIAADTKTRELREDPAPYIYLPIEQWSWLIGSDGMKLAVRENPGAVGTIDAVRQRVTALDPALPVTSLRTLDAQIFDQAMPQRVGALLLGMFGLMALVLAAVGVYGVISAAMARRVREISIRRAVGAHNSDVVRFVLWRGLLPALAGLPLGWFMAFGVSRLIGGFLPGLSPSDPATLTVATLLVFTVSLLACVPPALRAARRDPATALRAE